MDSEPEDIEIPKVDGRMSISVDEQLDDENTVGLGSIEPGDSTVVFEDARGEFTFAGRARSGGWNIGDEDSTIFVSCDGGELNVGFGPEFAPIETNLKNKQYARAMDELGGYYPQFDLAFDHAGIIAFIGEEETVLTSPCIWPWDYPHSQTAPGGPCGPRCP